MRCSILWATRKPSSLSLECPYSSEAGITRFLALFSEIGEGTPAADRLGSVRSARHYFVSFADEYDAIFVQYSAFFPYMGPVSA